ncbi:unnamed protein product [Porites lobata]|uniref:Protein kinase domain-containing protein n=1 Tax=Porites lobata TaxID=104759 RepID=A0ABN8RZR6_9CNID|nr:unnamed protein product [Porites lobata]
MKEADLFFRYWVWILEEGGNSSEKDVGNFTNHNFTLKWDKSYNFSVVAEKRSRKGGQRVYQRYSLLHQVGRSITLIKLIIYTSIAQNGGRRSYYISKYFEKGAKHSPPHPPLQVRVSLVSSVLSSVSVNPRQKLRLKKRNISIKYYYYIIIKLWAVGRVSCVGFTCYTPINSEKAPDSNKKDLLAEYELMKQLQPHPNVIRLMGAVTLSDPIMVLFEYIPYGDLLGFLRRSRGLDDKYYKDPDVKPSSSLTSQQLLRFAQEIADGMAFLAANKIIHRDLAARNVLVGEEEICKITDFGMARDVQQTDIYQKRTKSRLPVKWTAMESLLYGLCTSASDVWSYGIVLYEIFTIGGKPYPNLQAHRLPYLLKENYRMPKPAHLDDDM